MKNIYFTVIVILMMSGITFSSAVWRKLNMNLPGHAEPQQFYEEDDDNPGIYASYNKLSRIDRDFGWEPQPLCREVRSELQASLYVPHIENAEIYTFRPQKIYMVNCSREATALGTSDAMRSCWPQHCREKFVDIDIFGKPKTVQENLWQLLMEIPSVPIACECFA